MRMFFVPVCVVLSFKSFVCAQEKPQEIIQRAIKAHGGEDKLGRITCDKVKVQGTLLINGDEAPVPFTGETFVQLPATFKSTVTVTVNDRKKTVVQILNGDKTSVTLDGQPQKVTATADTDMRETMHLERSARLTPLLADKAYDLTLLDETKVNDRAVYGVKVSMKGHKDLAMYFDKETYLLVKTEHPHEDGGKEVKQEEYYSAFKDLGGGFKRPTKIMAYRDGKKLMDAELTEVKYLDRIPDAEFGKE